jgi:UDPglucose 6-dehydrogenase
MDLSVVGAGYVGLTTAACLAEIGHNVFCAESDLMKLNVLKSGKLPFFEPHLARLVEANRTSGRLHFTCPEDAVARTDAVFICVGTPPLGTGEADLSAIEHVGRTIMQHARGYRLVIEKSTVPVQTCQQLKRHLPLYGSSALTFDIVSNPEFLREGSAIEDFFHPDRIVVGVDRRAVAEQMRQIYQPILEQTFVCPVHSPCRSTPLPPLIVTDTNSAEIVKHASNSFLAMKISFVNLIADLCEAATADVAKVTEAIGLDRRIGPSFLRPGIGFGGFCFPKDLQAFANIAERFGCDFSLLKEVERINNRRVQQFVDKVKRELWIVHGKKIAVWGLAFKPNTDDVRFAPSIPIIRQLLAEGAEIRAYDPQAMTNAKSQLAKVCYCPDMYEAVRGAEAILLLTEWEEFLSADWRRVGALMERPLIIDGRNALSADQVISCGFEYVGTGTAAYTAGPSLAGERAHFQSQSSLSAPAGETQLSAPPSVIPSQAKPTSLPTGITSTPDSVLLPSYVLITPARNEAEFIELTINSVVAQTVRPVKWVIVSDGSTDGTDDIVARYAADHEWMELLRMPERRERHFAGKVYAFAAGYDRIKELNADVIGSLDADISFQPDYFSFLLHKLAEDPRLGLVGTRFIDSRDFTYDYRYVSVEHVTGCAMVFRRQCYEEIGGYIPSKGGGVDWIANIAARQKGWKTRTFTDKYYRHHRPFGTAERGTFQSRFKDGAKDYLVGSHPGWMLFRTAYQMTRRPIVIGGLALLSGYFWSWLRGVPRPLSDEMVEFHRREQMQRLRRFVLGRVVQTELHTQKAIN